MTLKIISLIVLTIGLFIIFFLLLLLGSLLFASAATNKESLTDEKILYWLLVAIHTGLNVFVISKRSELPAIYTWINTGLVACVYIFLYISVL